MLPSQFEEDLEKLQPVLCYGTRSALADQSYSACLCHA